MTELTILLHPLVVVNIADQYTRALVQDKNPRVYGCLVGKQEGRKVNVLHSFEILLDEKQVNAKFILTRGRQFYRVYAGMEVLGWYATGANTEPKDGDMEVHEQIQSLPFQPQPPEENGGDNTQINFSESPLFLCLNTKPSEKQKDLPMQLYENAVTIVEGKPRNSFQPIPFIIQTDEIERIGVDHLANISRSGTSLLQGHLSTLHSSVKMLNSRITILKNYLEAVKSGSLPPNAAVLRDIKSLCQQFPAIDTPEFKDEFLSEYNDALLLTYLASMGKTSIALSEMLDKFNDSYNDRAFRVRRGMGVGGY